MASVTVLDTAVEIIEYRGERVTTFAAVDRVHQRPDGTAGRAFRENRGRFVEGEDIVTLDQPDEIRRLGLTRPQGGTPGVLILVTHRGYLKLVKPLTDDRAWQVQGEMIDRYFAALVPLTASAPTVATAFESFFSIGSLIGLDRNQAALSANRATLASTGVDALTLMGQTHLVAPQQAPILTPTELGADLGGLSALKANALLAERGLQEAKRDPKGKAYWVATARGEPFAVYLDTGKRHGDGTPIRQLKWSADVLALLRATPAAA